MGERMEDDSAAEVENAAGLGVRYFEEVAQGREPKVVANWSVLRVRQNDQAMML